jgi:hypothetical protein
MIYTVQARNTNQRWHTVGKYYNHRTAISVAIDATPQAHFCQVVDEAGAVVWEAAPRGYDEPTADEQDRVFTEHCWPELAD